MGWENCKLTHATHCCGMDLNPELMQKFILSSVFALCQGDSKVDWGSQCPRTFAWIPTDDSQSKSSHATNRCETDCNPGAKFGPNGEHNPHLASAEPLWTPIRDRTTHGRSMRSQDPLKMQANPSDPPLGYGFTFRN